jgi:hypothetical protein
MGNSAVPSGGGVSDALRFLTDPEAIRQAARAATTFVEQAIALVKTAPDNPYQTDEEICGELLRQIKARKGKKLWHTA